MTKIHELLGVGMDEEFKVKDGDIIYKLSENGVLLRKGIRGSYPASIQTRPATVQTLVALINNPSLIIRKPKLTDEQRKVLDALLVLGYNWVAKDECNDVVVYSNEPTKGRDEWYGKDYVIGIPAISCIAPLLPDWTKQLDIEKTLKEASK